MYDLRVIVAVVVIHQLDTRYLDMHCSKLLQHFDDTVITFIRQDEGDHSIIETLQ